MEPDALLADAGYANERDLKALEESEDNVKKVDPKNEATLAMTKRLSADKVRAKHKERAWIAETPFVWIKNRRCFGQLSMRGLEKVQGEWDLVYRAQNLTKIFALEMV